MKKIVAMALLSLLITACESSSENQNANSVSKPAAATPVAATPAATSEASPGAPQIKAGDKVKITVNGAATEATVVSVDDKTGKATIRIQGQKEDKTVALSDIIKQ